MLLGRVRHEHHYLLFGSFGATGPKDHKVEHAWHGRETHDNAYSLRIEQTLKHGNRAIPHIIHDHVIVLLALGEISLGIVDDLIRAERAHHLDIMGAAYPRDLRAVGFGKETKKYLSRYLTLCRPEPFLEGD